jgi:hypothetical protein
MKVTKAKGLNAKPCILIVGPGTAVRRVTSPHRGDPLHLPAADTGSLRFALGTQAEGEAQRARVSTEALA